MSQALAAGDRVRLEQNEVVMRLEALRPEIDRHLQQGVPSPQTRRCASSHPSC
jgi:hypothetical protein